MKLTVMCCRVAVVAWILAPAGLLGAGFGIYEQSAKASALGGAFVARADDAAANWYNPAALVWLDGSELQVGINAVTAGGDTELTAQDPAFGIFLPTTFEMDSSLETPVHLYYRRKLNNNLAWGVGINTPYGLATEWSERPVTFAAKKSELATFYTNFNIAFRMTQTFAIGIGATYVVADLKEFSREVPIDLDGNPINGPEVIGTSNLSGDGNDWGWNVALHQKTPTFAFGATYRSDVTVELDGDLTFTDFGPLGGFFQDTPAGGDLPMPEQAAVGLAWLRNNWIIELDVAWVGWSIFDVLQVAVENKVPGFVDDIEIVEDFEDSMSYRLGVTRKTGGGNEWRFGLILEEGAVPEHTLRPSIPDGDRTAPTVGYGLNGQKWAIDLYYMALFIDDVTAVPGEEGVIAGDYSSFVNLGGVTFRRRF